MKSKQHTKKHSAKSKLLLAGLVVLLALTLWAVSYNFMAAQVGNAPPMEHNFSKEDAIAQVIAPMVNNPNHQADDTFTLTFEDELPNPTTPSVSKETHSDTKRHQLTLIIDDVGYNMQAMRRLIELPYNLVVSVLPDSPYAKQAAQMAYQHGIPVMLHMPMETTNPKYQSKMEKFYLHTAMSKSVFTQVFEDALAKVPHVVGVNNHMGSALTADAKSMRWLMQLCKKHNLFFVDSRTSSKSVAAEAAKQAGIAWNARDIFLDNSTKTEDLQHAWDSALSCIKRNDYCIMLAHPHPETLDFLEAHAQDLDAQSFTPIQNVLR